MKYLLSCFISLVFRFAGGLGVGGGYIDTISHEILDYVASRGGGLKEPPGISRKESFEPHNVDIGGKEAP